MFRKAIFSLLTLQFLTAFFHSLSFFTSPVSANETEKQLIDLFTNYKQDLGMGFNRSMYDLFRGLSACFTLICILGGWVNLYFLKNDLSEANLICCDGLINLSSMNEFQMQNISMRGNCKIKFGKIWNKMSNEGILNNINSTQYFP